MIPSHLSMAHFAIGSLAAQLSEHYFILRNVAFCLCCGQADTTELYELICFGYRESRTVIGSTHQLLLLTDQMGILVAN